MSHLTYLLSASALVILPGCGGGSDPGPRKTDALPILTSLTWSPKDASLSRYKSYAFTATATPASIGDTIARYEWDFGVGEAIQTSTTGTLNYAYKAVAGSYTLRVRAVDSRGNASAWFSQAFAVAEAPSPVSVAVTSPTAPQSFQLDAAGTASVQIEFTAATTQAGATIDASGIKVDAGDTLATVGIPTSLGGGLWRCTVTYNAATADGTRTVTPSVQVTDTAGYSSGKVNAPAVTITTRTAPNHSPSIAVLTPASTSPTGAFTSKPVQLQLAITDADGDPVSVTVDWGDGSKPDIQTTTGATQNGVSLSLNHAYADTFNPSATSTKDAIVTVTATDNHGTNGTASPQTRTFRVAFNALPTVTMTSPQASGTPLTPTELPPNPAIGLNNPAGANDPDFVVIPADVPVSFACSSTLPGSGDAGLVYKWTFEGGVPATSNLATPGAVTFPVNDPTKPEAHKVTVTVTDAFGRLSTAASPNPKTYQKWIVVDSPRTQSFKVQLMYRQKTEDPGGVLKKVVTPAVTTANGLGSTLQIFQDGRVSAYTVQNQQNAAILTVPVRANLPFDLVLGGLLGGKDAVMRIPNAPTGSTSDPDLGITAPVAGTPRATSSAFWFENPTSPTAPWNPVLQLVTGEGFVPETALSQKRTLNGSYGYLGTNSAQPGLEYGDSTVISNTRWVDRLNLPRTDFDPTVLADSYVGTYNGPGLQLHGDWVMALSSFKASAFIDPTAWGTGYKATDVVGTPDKVNFQVNYPAYIANNQESEAYSSVGLQAIRVPANTADPYYLSQGGPTNQGWNTPSTVVAPTYYPLTKTFDMSTGLQPTSLDVSYRNYLYNLLWASDTPAAALGGGIYSYDQPFATNATLLPIPKPWPTVTQGDLRETFSYAEYLWSSEWARPLVLNTAFMSFKNMQDGGWTGFPGFLSSRSTNWPNLTGLSVGNGSWAYNLTPTGGASFTNASPVNYTTGTSTLPTTGGVGRFFWTAATPNYGTNLGVISRTWLATDGSQLPPTTFAGADGDATRTFGFFPPQSLIVDKRLRDAQGNLVPIVDANGLPILDAQGNRQFVLGGYRVMWYNPTLDRAGSVVSPDFWVVLVGDRHFILPGGYPHGSNAQHLSDPVMTDARVYLPSNQTLATGPKLITGDPYSPLSDQAVPGACWFDLPVEFRPSGAVNVTVFAAKAILKNNPVAEARPMTRLDWIEAIRTATANVKINVPAGDFSFAHVLPFNYCWDIVVAQSGSTLVQP